LIEIREIWIVLFQTFVLLLPLGHATTNNFYAADWTNTSNGQSLTPHSTAVITSTHYLNTTVVNPNQTSYLGSYAATMLHGYADSHCYRNNCSTAPPSLPWNYFNLKGSLVKYQLTNSQNDFAAEFTFYYFFFNVVNGTNYRCSNNKAINVHWFDIEIKFMEDFNGSNQTAQSYVGRSNCDSINYRIILNNAVPATGYFAVSNFSVLQVYCDALQAQANLGNTELGAIQDSDCTDNPTHAELTGIEAGSEGYGSIITAYFHDWSLVSSGGGEGCSPPRKAVPPCWAPDKPL